MAGLQVAASLQFTEQTELMWDLCNPWISYPVYVVFRQTGRKTKYIKKKSTMLPKAKAACEQSYNHRQKKEKAMPPPPFPPSHSHTAIGAHEPVLRIAD